MAVSLGHKFRVCNSGCDSGRSPTTPWRWECTPKHADSVSQVSTPVCVSVSVAVGRLAAQKGAWAAASARAAGRASAWNTPPSPTPDPSRWALLPGKGESGGPVSQATWGGGGICSRSGAAGGAWSLPSADSTSLSPLQIFRRADKNGEFLSHAAPE